MKLIYKNKPVEGKALQILHVGPDCGMPVFLYADVIEELLFYAKTKDAFGLLMGSGCLDKTKESASGDAEPDKASAGDSPYADADVPDFIEITAFKDIYPVGDALDYADHLRKMRNFRDTESETLCLGAVCLTREKVDLSLECLFLLRSYFDLPTQILLFVSTDRAVPRAYQLNRQLELVEIGIDIVALKDSPLPFDV